ncbi:MAG: CheB methylesterase domain-containing protein, partial [Candidatus Glassbacteria bacterium]
DWLNQSTGFPVHLATAGEYILPGHAYFAPDDFNMGVSGRNQITLTREEKENYFRPSIAYLFRSVDRAYGANTAGVLLTGMGGDGAKELKLLKEKGAATIVQDKESSTVFGMPGEAVKLGAAQYVLPPEQIARALINLVLRNSLE